MFTLVSEVLRMWCGKPMYNVLMLGLDGSGKTVNPNPQPRNS